ncbi:N-acyl homoserine lactonase family protein [Henriciella sp.]|uniref:N-acyl homoserine lactonase family protein n=1 Tax=Henriciella sp. TaxID=1968823 RepID=UPI00262B5131|nr:N-acyl homoserine lactonase family protein [Henriciella sp.]
MKQLALVTTSAFVMALAACSGPDSEPPAEEAGTETAQTGETESADVDGAETPAETADPVDEASSDSVDSLQLIKLDCGEIYVSDLGIFSTNGDYDGQTDTFANTCWLVRHPEGDMLWDLGLPGVLTSEGEQTQGPFTVSLEQTIGEQLEDMDLGLSDIEYLAISHSHFDHTGQVDQIDRTGTTWLVNETEYEHMFPASTEGDAESSGEAANDFTGFDLLEHEIILDNHDVFGDGSVVIFMTPGHTPGHSSLLVNLPETGPVLLTGDLWHMEESRENERVPAFNTSEEATRQSMQEFEDRAGTLGARVIIQHEPADTEDLPDVMR